MRHPRVLPLRTVRIGGCSISRYVAGTYVAADDLWRAYSLWRRRADRSATQRACWSRSCSAPSAPTASSVVPDPDQVVGFNSPSRFQARASRRPSFGIDALISRFLPVAPPAVPFSRCGRPLATRKDFGGLGCPGCSPSALLTRARLWLDKFAVAAGPAPASREHVARRGRIVAAWRSPPCLRQPSSNLQARRSRSPALGAGRMIVRPARCAAAHGAASCAPAATACVGRQAVERPSRPRTSLPSGQMLSERLRKRAERPGGGGARVDQPFPRARIVPSELSPDLVGTRA